MTPVAWNIPRFFYCLVVLKHLVLPFSSFSLPSCLFSSQLLLSITWKSFDHWEEHTCCLPLLFICVSTICCHSSSSYWCSLGSEKCPKDFQSSKVTCLLPCPSFVRSLWFLLILLLRTSTACVVDAADKLPGERCVTGCSRSKHSHM